MTPTIHVEDWSAYRYLVDALFRVRPDLDVAVRPYRELDHPVVSEAAFVSAFIAYRDETAEPVFCFPGVVEALDRRFPGLALCGEDRLRRGIVRSACQIIDEGHLMLAAGHIGQWSGYDGPMWHEGSIAHESFIETYVKKMHIMERIATGDTYLLGPRPYLPDLIIAACIWFASDVGLQAIPSGCDKLAAWYARHSEAGTFRHPAR